MNYKKNAEYFKSSRKYNIFLCVFFLLGAGASYYFQSISGESTPALYVIPGVAVLMAFVFPLLFPLRKKIPDNFIDKQVTEATAVFEQMAIKQLGITPVPSEVLKPVRFFTFIDKSEYKDMEIAILTKIGNDGIKRTSQGRITGYFFSSNKFIAYTYEFSLIKPWLAEGFSDFYYEAISTKHVHEVSTADNSFMQIVDVSGK